MKGKKTGGRQAGTSNKHGAEVREMAAKYKDLAIRTIVSLMKSKKSGELTKFYCAQELLNRGWGRPATAVTGEDGTGPPRVELTVVNEYYP
jgi:hypothetical protein